MTEEVNAAVDAAPEEQVAPQLSLQDIATVAQVIDICSKRGAFEGGELEAVGAVRNRIVAFLQAAAPAQGEEVPEGEVPAGDDLPTEEAEVA
jgi:hypothetical protein